MSNIVALQEQICDMVARALERAFGTAPEVIKLTSSNDIRFGDFSFACFDLAKGYSTNPAAIAQRVVDQISATHIGKNEPSWLFSEIKAVGGYVNFRIQSQVLFALIIASGDQSNNLTQIGQGQNVMVEYLSPNTNKPLHLGHVRNGALGMAVANILEAVGYNVVKADLINDRGIHICKSMLAWMLWANGATPELTGKKGDHFVGDYYVMFANELKRQCQPIKEEMVAANPNLKIEEIEDDDLLAQTEIGQAAQSLLQRWEAGDQEVRSLWQTMNEWVLPGFDDTCGDFGFQFDRIYYESQTYLLGKDIIESGLARGVFYKDENGAVVAMLPAKEFGTEQGTGREKRITVLRSDGTSVYMTQDIGTAQLKHDEFGLDRSIYVVAHEQDYHFKCLFQILRSLNLPWADGCYHLSYGMVNLPDGKMKSREGTVVDADMLMENLTLLAATEVRQHNDQLSEDEIYARAKKIALGAIKFYLLRVSPVMDITFDPRESISFEGNTGPYCQYTYARCCTIIEKAAGLDLAQTPDWSLLGNDEERALAQKIGNFTECVRLAAKEMSPAKVVNSVFELAKTFNFFYEKHTVINREDLALTAARLALIKTTALVLKRGLALLGIPVLEKM